MRILPVIIRFHIGIQYVSYLSQVIVEKFSYLVVCCTLKFTARCPEVEPCWRLHVNDNQRGREGATAVTVPIRPYVFVLLLGQHKEMFQSNGQRTELSRIKVALLRKTKQKTKIEKVETEIWRGTMGLRRLKPKGKHWHGTKIHVIIPRAAVACEGEPSSHAAAGKRRSLP